MEIKKILKVESAVHLYRLLDVHNDELETLEGDSSIRVQYYMDLASEYLYGCKCEEETNWERLSAEYEAIRSDDKLLSSLCSALFCDRIDFN